MQAFAVILLSLVCLDTAYAAAGKLLFVSGPVTIERPTPVPASAGDAVEQGDVIATGAKARAQLLMNDGARIALRSGSRFRIDEFSLPAAVTAPVRATTANASGRTVSSLLKGGFRTTSGAIGKGDPAAYAVRTPVGTLGIRGTRYVAVWCTGDCRDAPGVLPGDVIRDGLYLGVEEGVVVFEYGGVEFRLTAGQVMFFPAGGGTPESLDRAPAWLDQDGAGRFQLAGGGGSKKASEVAFPGVNERRGPAGQGKNPNDEQPKAAASPGVDQQIQGTFQGETVDLTPAGPQSAQRRDLAWSVAALTNAPTGYANVEDVPAASYALDGNGNLVRFVGDFPTGSVVTLSATYDLGTAAVVNATGSPVAILRWGRWSGGEMGVNVNGTPSTTSLTQQSLHWILSGNADGAPVLSAVRGTVAYTLAGATNPTDNAGNVGTLGTANLTADFTNNLIDSTLNLTIAGNTWTASGSGAIGAQAGVPAHQFEGFYNTIQIDPIQGTGTGTFSGFFSGPATGAGGAPAGAGITFNLNDSLGLSQVNGAAAFVAP